MRSWQRTIHGPRVTIILDPFAGPTLTVRPLSRPFASSDKASLDRKSVPDSGVTKSLVLGPYSDVTIAMFCYVVTREFQDHRGGPSDRGVLIVGASSPQSTSTYCEYD